MPKRKRLDCVEFGNESAINNQDDGDLIIGNTAVTGTNGDVITNPMPDTTTQDDQDDDLNNKSRRKSKRIVKPRSLDASPNVVNGIPSFKKLTKPNQIQQSCDQLAKIKLDESVRKSSRKWEMWTEDDTKWFFEALCEHGKDFTKIQNYMAQRSEKKGIPQVLIKNKEQVRHYYYRTWHKIANNLKITNSNVVDKGTQEIYGLINYGEIWKKFGSKFDNKLGHHLQELVHYGHTICKMKGKSIRIKTPICKALKKLHNLGVADNSKICNPNLLNLPKEITVELYPGSNSAWLRVQSMAQNPRVRTKLPLQKRLAVLIEYLENRWNPSRIIESKCHSLCGISLPQTSNSTEMNSSSNSTESNSNQCFRIRPHHVEELKNVSLSRTSLYNNHSQMDLSLGAYLNKLFYNDEFKGHKHKKHKKVKEKANDKPENGSKLNQIKSNEKNEEEKIEDENEDKLLSSEKSENEQNKSDDEEDPISEAERSLTLLKMLASMNEKDEQEQDDNQSDEEDDEKEEEENKDEDVNKDDEVNKEEDINKEEDEIKDDEVPCDIRLPVPPPDATIAQWLSEKNVNEDNKEQDQSPEQQENETENIESIGDANESQIFELSAERARKGWSLAEAGSMTIGELYLLLRCPAKIVLEYQWETKAQCCQQQTSCENSESDKNSNENSNDKTKTHQSLLTKLLFSANLSLINMKATTTPSSETTLKKRRIKPTRIDSIGPPPNLVTNSSQLLSSVISNTIFNSDDNDENKIVTPTSSSSKEPDCDKQISQEKEKHNFIVPTSPAPKAINKSKSRTICGDPALIQEALKQLQSNKYTKRQRRPAPKPVFSQANKPLLPRVSPVIQPSVTSNQSLSSQVYVIQPQLNAIVSQQAKASTTTILSQGIPVTNINLASLNSNANELNKNTDAIGTIILQQQNPIVMSQANVVNSLVNTVSPSTNINPFHKTTAHLYGTISSSTPIITSIPHQIQLQTTSDHTDLVHHKTNANSIGNNSVLNGVSTNQIVNSNILSDELTSLTSNVITSNSLTNSSTPTITTTFINDKNDEDARKSPSLSTPPLTSPPPISSLLEISLPEPPTGFNSLDPLPPPSSETANQLAIVNRPFGSLNSTQNNSHTNDPTLPPPAPSSSSSSSLTSSFDRLKSTSPNPDHNWLNGESSDVSIGSFLNAYESQCKISSESQSNFVDTHMNCLVNDNSIDLMAKFADLAAQIVDSNSKST